MNFPWHVGIKVGLTVNKKIFSPCPQFLELYYQSQFLVLSSEIYTESMQAYSQDYCYIAQILAVNALADLVVHDQSTKV